MYTYIKNSTSTHLCVLLLLVCLIFSFGMHAIQILHDHMNVGGSHAHEKTTNTEISEYMHHADKKYFDARILGAVLIFFCTPLYILLIRLHTALHKRLSHLRALYKAVWRIESYVMVLLQKGILHPKSF